MLCCGGEALRDAGRADEGTDVTLWLTTVVSVDGVVRVFECEWTADVDELADESGWPCGC